MIILVKLHVAALCICRLGEGFILGVGFKLTISVWDIKSIVDTVVCGIVAASCDSNTEIANTHSLEIMQICWS